MNLTKEKVWTYDEYYKFNDNNRYEVLNGELIMVPAPDSNHQRISRNIEFKIFGLLKKHSIGEVFNAPYDVILDDKSIVQPDILLVLNNNKDKIKKRGFFGVPDLIVEIISPSSRYRDTVQKKDLYEKFGVTEYWLVDPKAEYVEVLTLNNGKYELYSEAYFDEEDKQIVASKLIKELTIELKEIFDEKFIN